MVNIKKTKKRMARQTRGQKNVRQYKKDGPTRADSWRTKMYRPMHRLSQWPLRKRTRRASRGGASRALTLMRSGRPRHNAKSCKTARRRLSRLHQYPSQNTTRIGLIRWCSSMPSRRASQSAASSAPAQGPGPSLNLLLHESWEYRSSKGSMLRSRHRRSSARGGRRTLRRGAMQHADSLTLKV
jgi:hypothetical protein